MLIYRIEHAAHRTGPFTCSVRKNEDFRAWWELIHEDLRNYPTGWEDKIENRAGYDSYYGCPSLKALDHWFGVAYDVLDGLGFVLNVYETDDFEVGVSGLQVVFDRKLAALLQTVPLTKVNELTDA